MRRQSSSTLVVSFSSFSPFLPLLLLCCFFSALLLGSVPSLCHLVDGDSDDDLRLSLPFLLAAIPTSFFSLNLLSPIYGDRAEIEAHIREGRKVFEQQNETELEPMSQRMGDVFEAFGFLELAESMLLSEASLKNVGMDKGQQHGIARLNALVNACVDSPYYHDLSIALIGFITNMKDDRTLKNNHKKLRTIPNRMFSLLLFDRIYGTFEQQIAEIIDQKIHSPRDLSRAEFALKWLKQMRKEISKRYELNEAEMKHLLTEKSRDLEGLINRTESERKKARERLGKAFTRRMEKTRDKSARNEAANSHLGQLGTVNKMHGETSQRFGAAMRNGHEIGRIIGEMGGTGDWVVTVVRAQIKLSLAINEQRGEEEEGKTPNDGGQASSSSSSRSSSPNNNSNSSSAALILSEFLRQNAITMEKNGGVIFDASEALGNFLTHYGYSNLRRELSNIYTNQSNGWHRGGRRSLMRTHRLIKPKLDAEMGRIWKYGNILKAFGQIFEETVAKIEQIGAFVLYLYLYKSLLNQHLFGWTEKAKKAIPILYAKFMCPEEFIGYWLDQMSESLCRKVKKAKRELKELLMRDREKLNEMEKIGREKNGQINGQSLAQNANRAIVVYEKKPNWKKAENYLLRIGKKLKGKLHKKMPSLSQTDGTIGRSQRMTTTSAFPQGKMGEMPPNWHEIEKAIKLNEEVTIILA
ncbi:hypothetical protein niasHS_003279 [Heterodera schachtii]|uniref:Uncharacterized protein n=1 Tax=Heterodera schachtii TaxID=97005 RepID=A0ABD2KG14_HETSC